MSQKLVFPSLANPSLRYVYNEDTFYNWEMWRNQGGLDQYATVYDTLGDGDTQHTPARMVRLAESEDFFNSFKRFVALNTEKFINGEFSMPLKLVFSEISEERIEFAHKTRRAKEGQDLWYSVLLRKRTSKDMSHDRRYAQYPSEESLAGVKEPVRIMWLLGGQHPPLDTLLGFASIIGWLNKNTKSHFSVYDIASHYKYSGWDMDSMRDAFIALRSLVDFLQNLYKVARIVDIEKRSN